METSNQDNLSWISGYVDIEWGGISEIACTLSFWKSCSVQAHILSFNFPQALHECFPLEDSCKDKDFIECIISKLVLYLCNEWQNIDYQLLLLYWMFCYIDMQSENKCHDVA